MSAFFTGHAQDSVTTASVRAASVTLRELSFELTFPLVLEYAPERLFFVLLELFADVVALKTEVQIKRQQCQSVFCVDLCFRCSRTQTGTARLARQRKLGILCAIPGVFLRVICQPDTCLSESIEIYVVCMLLRTALRETRFICIRY